MRGEKRGVQLLWPNAQVFWHWYLLNVPLADVP